MLSRSSSLLRAPDATSRRARRRAPGARTASSFAGFDGWCTSRGLCSCPAAPATVAVYLAALADAGAAVSTIERALAGIAHEHRSRGITWQRGEPAIRETMAGIRRKLGTAPGSKKAPVGDGELAALVATLGEDLVGLRDRALLTLGWSSACRRSELVALDVADVESSSAKASSCTSGARRATRRARASTRASPTRPRPRSAPCARSSAWLDAAGITEGPIFRGVDRHGHVVEEAPLRSLRRADRPARGEAPRASIPRATAGTRCGRGS